MRLSEAIDGYRFFESSSASATTIKTDRVLLRQCARWAQHDPVVTDIDADGVRRFITLQRGQGERRSGGLQA